MTKLYWYTRDWDGCVRLWDGASARPIFRSYGEWNNYAQSDLRFSGCRAEMILGNKLHGLRKGCCRLIEIETQVRTVDV